MNTVTVKNTEIGRDFIGRDQINLPTPSQIDKHNENYKNEIANNKITTKAINTIIKPFPPPELFTSCVSFAILILFIPICTIFF